MSASLEGLAADVAAAQETTTEAAAPETTPETAAEETSPEVTEDDGQDEVADGEPVNVKSVETVSAMDLIMGAAEEDSATSDEDDAPASA
jgi:hypothetical protein